LSHHLTVGEITRRRGKHVGVAAPLASSKQLFIKKFQGFLSAELAGEIKDEPAKLLYFSHSFSRDLRP